MVVNSVNMLGAYNYGWRHSSNKMSIWRTTRMPETSIAQHRSGAGVPYGKAGPGHGAAMKAPGEGMSVFRSGGRP